MPFDHRNFEIVILDQVIIILANKDNVKEAGVRSRLEHRPIITLLTDFGAQDAYVSSMKGIILGLCPEAVIVDISHEVHKFDVKMGAFLLHQAAPYFPKGTIHTVVVDPGVGTARRRIIVEGGHSLFVGPDNGVFALAIQRESFVKAVEITEKKFMLPNPSPTFDGRDIFAPVSAHLACGVRIEEFGDIVSSIVTPPYSRPTIQKDKIVGEVLAIDDFGNIITNIPYRLLHLFKAGEGALFRVKVDATSETMKLSRTYGNVPIGTSVLVVGSSNFLEVSINQGSSSNLFQADVGSKIELALVTSP
jgi:S-adenosylmethionine hydrolase